MGIGWVGSVGASRGDQHQRGRGWGACCLHSKRDGGGLFEMRVIEVKALENPAPEGMTRGKDHSGDSHSLGLGRQAFSRAVPTSSPGAAALPAARNCV